MRSAIVSLWVSLIPLGSAWAKPWNGIDPGTSGRGDVVKKFGEPSKVTTVGRHEVLTYLKEKAIKGTVQSQFRVEKDSGVVDRIDVFPEPIIDQEAIEKNYGAQCAPGEKAGCYLLRTQDKRAAYFLYTQLGLAIFFREDGKTVQSFAFLPAKK
jgi:hypothetical protein